jgi:hypothetical protein
MATHGENRGHQWGLSMAADGEIPMAAVRLVRPLSQRRFLTHLQLPARLHLAAGRSLAAPETPPSKLALAQAPLPPGVVANPWRDGAL